MPYNGLIDRTDAGALIPEEVSREIIQSVPQQSAVMQLARKLPNMARAQQRLPILSALVSAYFVNGDTGLKQTTEAAWANKYINAEEIAAIVPIPEAVLDDSDYDIWGEIKPKLIEAFGQLFDKAVLFGTNAPASWPDDVLTGAVAASHTLKVGALGAGKDTYDELLGESGTLQMVETDGFAVNGHVGAPTMRGKLRGLRDTVGQPIFMRSMQDRARYELDAESIYFPMNGSMDASKALLISGDWSQLVYALRQDITYKILTEAVITDAAGNIIYNLAQQDMVALRAVMRLGWQLPNPINRMATDDSTRYPFAALVP